MTARMASMLWLILLPVAASAATGDLAVDIEEIIRSNYLDDRQEYVLTIPETAATPESGYDSLQLTPLRNVVPRGNFPVKVTFIKDGLAVRSANLAIYIAVYRQVLVAKRRIVRSEPLLPELFLTARREVSSLHAAPLVSSEQLQDMSAASTIRAGQVLVRSLVKKQQLVKRGDLVQIEYSEPNLRLTASGEAKQSGGRGDLIKVRNISSNRSIIAEVKDDQTVKVVK